MDCLIYTHKEELESCDDKTEVFAYRDSSRNLDSLN